MGARTDWPEWLKRHWFPIALVLVAFAGYGVGKDRAMVDNNRDTALRASQNPEG